MKHVFNPDTPLMRALSALFDWGALSLTAVVCALPLVTAGTALSALYGTLSQPEAAGLVDFLRRFRRDLRRTVVLWLTVLAAGGVLALDVWIVARMPAGVRIPLWGGVFFLGLCLLLAGTVLFPLAASAPEASCKALWRRALFLSIDVLPRTLLMLAAAAVPAAVYAGAPRLFWALGLAWVFVWPVLMGKIWVRAAGAYLKMG